MTASDVSLNDLFARIDSVSSDEDEYDSDPLLSDESDDDDGTGVTMPTLRMRRVQRPPAAVRRRPARSPVVRRRPLSSAQRPARVVRRTRPGRPGRPSRLSPPPVLRRRAAAPPVHRQRPRPTAKQRVTVRRPAPVARRPRVAVRPAPVARPRPAARPAPVARPRPAARPAPAVRYASDVDMLTDDMPARVPLPDIDPQAALRTVVEPEVIERLRPGEALAFLQREGLLKPVPPDVACLGCYLSNSSLELFTFLQHVCKSCTKTHNTILTGADIHGLYDEGKLRFRNLRRLTLGLQEAAQRISRYPIVVIAEGGYRHGKGGHRNALFFYVRPRDHRVELRIYDPKLHQEGTGQTRNVVMRWRKLIKNWLPGYIQRVLPGWTVGSLDFGESCPVGLQSVEAREEVDEGSECHQLEPGGYCSAWSSLLILLQLVFPFASVNAIAQNIMKSTTRLRPLIQRFSFNAYSFAYQRYGRKMSACCKERSRRGRKKYYPDDPVMCNVKGGKQKRDKKGKKRSRRKKRKSGR